MNPMLRRISLVVGTMALAACASITGADDHPDDVRFTPERARYAPGDSLAATLRNDSEVALGYNLCGTRLELRSGSEWVSVDEPLWVCTADLKTLNPGESVGYGRRLPPSLEPGTYRLQTGVWLPLQGGGRVAVRSEHFVIAR